jgi:hypothetical protein
MSKYKSDANLRFAPHLASYPDVYSSCELSSTTTISPEIREIALPGRALYYLLLALLFTIRYRYKLNHESENGSRKWFESLPAQALVDAAFL